MSKLVRRSHRIAQLAFLASCVVAAACSAAPPDDASATQNSAIIGGVAIDSAAMDAVGSLVTIYSRSGTTPVASTPICSATLIGPQTVLTAKHCVQGGATTEFGFAIGANGMQPKLVVPAILSESEPTVSGGFVGFGSDVAILQLEKPVQGITPLAWAPLTQSDVGTRLFGVGYGTQDNAGAYGTRRGGSLTIRGVEGKAFELAFGSFEAFVAAIPTIDSLRYELSGDLTTPENQARARAIYDARTLLPGGYEALGGNLEGDAQLCHGDSGGPLLRRDNGKNVVVGVASWVDHNSEGYGLCDHMSVFATFGPATQTFIANSLAWEDPCDGMNASGVCQGDTAVRCATRSEGKRRVFETDCAAIGLSCGTGATGQVNCFDPAEPDTRNAGDGGRSWDGGDAGDAGIPSDAGRAGDAR